MSFILKFFSIRTNKLKKTQYDGFLRLFDKKIIKDILDDIGNIERFVSNKRLDEQMKDFFQSFYSEEEEKSDLVKDFFTLLLNKHSIENIGTILGFLSYPQHNALSYSNMNLMINLSLEEKNDEIVIDLLKWSTLIFNDEGNKGMKKITKLFKFAVKNAIDNDNKKLVSKIMNILGLDLNLAVDACPVDFDIPCTIVKVYTEQIDVGWLYNFEPIIIKRVEPDVIWKYERGDDTPDFFIKEYFQDLYKKFLENPRIGILLRYKLL